MNCIRILFCFCLLGAALLVVPALVMALYPTDAPLSMLFLLVVSVFCLSAKWHNQSAKDLRRAKNPPSSQTHD
jgi:hypothetical protein